MSEAVSQRSTYPLADEQIQKRIHNTPMLGSLKSINYALGELLASNNSFTAQIAEIIRRDLSLTSRLLRAVNSAFFGLSQRVSHIEDAVVYLGFRQIRQLAMATPVIEEYENFKHNFSQVDWRTVWQHSIGCALLTREILAAIGVHYEDDTDYVVGLFHDIGKLIMAMVFPEIFKEIIQTQCATPEQICELERTRLGWDHGQVGSYYLNRHGMSSEIVAVAQFHCNPSAAPEYQNECNAVHVSDYLLRSIQITGTENTGPIELEACFELPSWKNLIRDNQANEKVARSWIASSLSRLPLILNDMV